MKVMVTRAGPLASTVSWPGRAAANAEGASKNVGPTCRRAAQLAIAVPLLSLIKQKTQAAALSAVNVMAGNHGLPPGTQSRMALLVLLADLIGECKSREVQRPGRQGNWQDLHQLHPNHHRQGCIGC